MFEVGQRVIYTNPQGVCWGEHRVTEVVPEFTQRLRDAGKHRYHITPTDTPWYPVGEDCLKAVEAAI
jgi:hypothetical protein